MPPRVSIGAGGQTESTQVQHRLVEVIYEALYFNYSASNFIRVVVNVAPFDSASVRPCSEGLSG
jgi:hypothetical protein